MNESDRKRIALRNDVENAVAWLLKVPNETKYRTTGNTVKVMLLKGLIMKNGEKVEVKFKSIGLGVYDVWLVKSEV